MSSLKNSNKRKNESSNGDGKVAKVTKKTEESEEAKVEQVPMKKQKKDESVNGAANQKSNGTSKANGHKTNGDVKMAESSDSDSSSSDEEEIKPAAKSATPAKKAAELPQAKKTPQAKPAPAKKQESESSSDSSSDSDDEEVEKPQIKKTPQKPEVTKPQQKTAPKKQESSDSDSSSSDSEDEKPAPKADVKKAPVAEKKAVEKKPVEQKAAPTKISAKELAESLSYRNDNNVTFEDAHRGEDYPPIKSFEEAKSIFSDELLSVTKGFSKPTPIQAQSWPVARAGRDIVAIAETGSGKTLSFTLPILAKITSDALSKPLAKGYRTPLVLVLAPTRELAMQTAEVCEAAGAFVGLKALCVYGGVPKEGNVKSLKQGVDILIATPGRLQDLMDDGIAKLDKVAHLVLDEADRMLDMGFEPAIRRIVSQVPEKRQTLMFSATWPQSIQTLANEFLSEPAKVVIGSQDLTANHKVTQIVEVMENYHKEQRLLDLLNKIHKSRTNRILVFALYKKEAERIENTLRRRGFKVQGIHGDKSQALRTKAIESFRDGSQPLLIATDVAARGLDIPDVEYVVNVTFPLTIEDYVHRIGRTGRAGKTGTAYTFFTSEDKTHAGELQTVLREANQDVPENLLAFGSHVKKKEHALYGSHFKKIDTNQKATRTTFD